MNLFSISDLEQFSGIKTHTIRAWEQRYGALTPHRSEGNTRYYDNTQLRRLLNIVSLLSYDYKVSELCAKTDQQLYTLLHQNFNVSETTGDSNTPFISQLINAGMNFDEVLFDKIFSHCILKMGIKKTYTDIIYPLLERVGLMWATAEITPAYEHFISNLVRQKLFTAIDSLPMPAAGAENWVLFLPENEFHEIGLLFAHYLIKESGRKVIYLGSNIPIDTLKHTAQGTKPSHLLCFLVHHQTPSEIKKYITQLKSCFPKTYLYIAGSEKILGPVPSEKNTQKIISVDDFIKLLS
jgi:methanogenic corrinoid protein MtbC1